MKKVLVVLGSPRKSGNSATLAQNAIAAAEAEGAEVEKFYLHELDIKPCNACEVCREGDELDCNIDDDMKILYPKLREADSIVIASPIYWFTFSAQTKLFMDRCYALEGPHGNALRWTNTVNRSMMHRRDNSRRCGRKRDWGHPQRSRRRRDELLGRR